jgi:hypothetical protein
MHPSRTPQRKGRRDGAEAHLREASGLPARGHFRSRVAELSSVGLVTPPTDRPLLLAGRSRQALGEIAVHDLSTGKRLGDVPLAARCLRHTGRRGATDHPPLDGRHTGADARAGEAQPQRTARDFRLTTGCRISSALRARRILILDGNRAVLGNHQGLLQESAMYQDLLGRWTAPAAAGAAWPQIQPAS